MCADGVQRTVDDIQTGQGIVSLNDETLRFERDTITHKVYSGRKPVLRIQTRTGKVLRVTPEHRVRTFDGWKAAGELTTEDRLASPRRIPALTAVAQGVSDEEVRLIAYLLAEGGLSQTAILFTNADKPVVEDFRRCAEALGFGVTRNEDRIRSSLVRAKKNPHDWLRSLGLKGHTALTKRVPSVVFSLPSRQKWMFLGSLMVTDGWFGAATGNGGITLANEGLIDDINSLFMHVGIVATKAYRPNDCAGAWSLTFGGAGVASLVRHCDLLQKAAKARTILRKRRYSLIDTYPNAILRFKRMAGAWYRRRRARVDVKYELTREKLKRLIALDAAPEWVRYEQAEVFWDSIAAITADGETETFDVQVQRNASLLTDGLVTHNSTIATTVYPIWLQCYGIEPFTLLLSHTDAQVVRLFNDLKEPILNETGDYDRLHRVFGDRLRLVQNNDHNLVFTDGSAIVASSRGASTRGMKRGGKRPGRVIIDDLENEETVATGDQRDKTWSWLTRTVQPMLDPERGRTVWVGTLLHEDAAMPRAEASGSYRVIKKQSIIKEPTNTALWDEYEAVWTKVAAEGKNGKLEARAFYEAHKEAMDEGAEVAWPTRFPYIYLREERRRLGSFAFSREYQNEPVASENQIVQPHQIHDFRMEPFVEQGIPDTYLIGGNGTVVKLSECTLYVSIDPAISEATGADFFVIAVMAAHPTGSRWFVDFVRDHLSYDKQLDAAVQTYSTWRQRVGDRIIAMGIETVAYQKALKQGIDKAAREKGLSIPTRELKPVTDKVLRLTRHQPTFEQGLVYVQKKTHPFVEQEVCGFTRDGKIKPAHDDSMDAIVYDLMLAESTGLSEQMQTFTFNG